MRRSFLTQCWAAWGHSSPCYRDDGTPEGCEEQVIELYAGAEAQRRVEPDDPDTLAMIEWSAGYDEGAAADYLRFCNRSEAELRRVAADLVSEHWALIELIASELQKFGVLLGEELDILLDVYKGESTIEDVERVRSLLIADRLASLRGVGDSP